MSADLLPSRSPLTASRQAPFLNELSAHVGFRQCVVWRDRVKEVQEGISADTQSIALYYAVAFITNHLASDHMEGIAPIALQDIPTKVPLWGGMGHLFHAPTLPVE